jgi:excisionase family DNA binding protein
METKESKNSPRDYVTLMQASRATGINDGTLRRWIRSGVIEGFKNKTGTLYFFHKDQLEELRKMALPSKISAKEIKNISLEVEDALPYDSVTGEVLMDRKVRDCEQTTVHSTGCVQQELRSLSDESKLVLGDMIIERLCDLIK